jgi:hypothetical protein
MRRDTNQVSDAFENRLRRLAVRHKLRLHRYRVRDPLAPEYGLFWLSNDEGQIVALGIRPDQVEDVIKMRAQIVKTAVAARTVEQIMTEAGYEIDVV